MKKECIHARHNPYAVILKTNRSLPLRAFSVPFLTERVKTEVDKIILRQKIYIYCLLIYLFILLFM
jgi:hypothetical protein